MCVGTCDITTGRVRGCDDTRLSLRYKLRIKHNIEYDKISFIVQRFLTFIFFLYLFLFEVNKIK